MGFDQVPRSRITRSTLSTLLGLAVLAMLTGCQSTSDGPSAATTSEPHPDEQTATASHDKTHTPAPEPRGFSGSTNVRSDNGYTVRIDYELGPARVEKSLEYEEPGYAAAFVQVAGSLDVANTTEGREVDFPLGTIGDGLMTSSQVNGPIDVIGRFRDRTLCTVAASARESVYSDIYGYYREVDGGCLVGLATFAIGPFPTTLGPGESTTLQAPYGTLVSGSFERYAQVLPSAIETEGGPTIVGKLPESQYHAVAQALADPDAWILAFGSYGPYAVGGNWEQDCPLIASSDPGFGCRDLGVS